MNWYVEVIDRKGQRSRTPCDDKGHAEAVYKRINTIGAYPYVEYGYVDECGNSNVEEATGR